MQSHERFFEVLHGRTAARHYAADTSISEEDIRAMVEDALESPSSFNLQHWRFLAVTDAGTKEQLAACTLPSNRQRVLEAPVSLLILGDTQAHLGIAAILDGSVAAGTLTREVANERFGFATKVYFENVALAREEAIRSCSLAAMTLMLSANHRGFGTCPMGFNAPDLTKLLELSERYVPVIWITLGKAVQPVSRCKPRRPVSEVFTANTPPIWAN